MIKLDYKATRTKIRQDGSSVILTTPDGKSREFYSSGEYLWERCNRTQASSQVCEGLFHRGNTIHATPENLRASVVREWRSGYNLRKRHGEI